MQFFLYFLNFGLHVIQDKDLTFTVNVQEEFQETKGVIRIRKSKDRQHNSQKQKDKRTNSNLQNITHKTKDRVT